jgi:hypothetical protein
MPRVFMSSMQKVRVPMMQGWLEIEVFLVREQARTPEVTIQQHSLRLPAEILRAVRLLRLSDPCTIGAPPHLHMCQHRSLLLITYALRSLCRDLPLNRYVCLESIPESSVQRLDFSPVESILPGSPADSV